MTLGEFIRQYRSDHEMSIRSFASMVGMSTQQISNIEKGRGNNGKKMTSTMKTYAKIAEAIGMTEQDFLNMLNDNVLVNPTAYQEEDIKNLPIFEKDGQMLLNLSEINERQRRTIILVLQADQQSLSSALQDLEPHISDLPSPDVQQ